MEVVVQCGLRIEEVPMRKCFLAQFHGAPFITAHTNKELDQNIRSKRARQQIRILQKIKVPSLLLDVVKSDRWNRTPRDSMAMTVNYDEVANLLKQDMGVFTDWRGMAPANLSLTM
jgi:hypothetical protein